MTVELNTRSTDLEIEIPNDNDIQITQIDYIKNNRLMDYLMWFIAMTMAMLFILFFVYGWIWLTDNECVNYITYD